MILRFPAKRSFWSRLLAAVVCFLTSALAFAQTSRYFSSITGSQEAVANTANIDAIVDKIQNQYGKTVEWRKFPLVFRPNASTGYLGCAYMIGGIVTRIEICESYSSSYGKTLDHELTHAYFCFRLKGAEISLLINEGLAENAEYLNYASERNLVARRYRNGDFVRLSYLENLSDYDGNLLQYTQGFSIVDYLIQLGGREWLGEAVDFYGKKRSLDRMLIEYYGFAGLDDFEQKWILFLRRGQTLE